VNQAPDPFLRGLWLFRQGQEWEAHEVWEDLWRRAGDPERTLLKALIQVAAARIHARQGHWRGVQGLLQRVARYLQQVPPGTLGVDVLRLRQAVARALETARHHEACHAPGQDLDLGIPLVDEPPKTP